MFEVLADGQGETGESAEFAVLPEMESPGAADCPANAFGVAGANVAGSVVACLIAVWLGYAAATALNQLPRGG